MKVGRGSGNPRKRNRGKCISTSVDLVGDNGTKEHYPDGYKLLHVPGVGLMDVTSRAPKPQERARAYSYSDSYAFLGNQDDLGWWAIRGLRALLKRFVGHNWMR
jgi:hypothetical protein